MRRTFRLSAGALLHLWEGDITAWRGDAIVNAAKNSLLGGGGVDGAIHRAAGPELREVCAELPSLADGVRCPTGTARLTRATGALSARVSHIIHGVGPRHRQPRSADLLAGVYRAALKIAAEERFKTIAFPAISCGVYGYPLEEAAAIALAEVDAATAPDQSITFALFDPAAMEAWQGAAAAAGLVRLQETPVLECRGCGMRLTGLRCRGSRPGQLQASYSGDGYYGYKRDPLPPGVVLPVETTGCGELLEWRGGRLHCPEGCGAVAPSCQKHGALELASELWGGGPGGEPDEGTLSDKEPPVLMTCPQCGWSLDGLACADESHHRAMTLKHNGAILRIWCHHAWSCPSGCGREAKGGIIDGESLRCGCDASGALMRPLDYLERNGPPSN